MSRYEGESGNRGERDRRELIMAVVAIISAEGYPEIAEEYLERASRTREYDVALRLAREYLVVVTERR